MLKRQHLQDLTHQFLFFHGLITAANNGLWAFYITFLLRQTNNAIETIFLNFACMYTGLLLGYIVGTSVVSKFGYLHMYRLSMMTCLLATIGIIVNLDNVVTTYPLWLTILGIGKGIFWSINNLFSLREIHGSKRSETLSLLVALSILIIVVVPISAGAIVEQAGYLILFVLSALVYILGVIYPWSYNKKPRQSINPNELIAVSSRRGFKRWTALTFISEMQLRMREYVIALIPFLFIQSEFGVGALTSLIGLIGAFMVFSHRRDPVKNKIHYAWFGAGTIAGFTTLLVLVWSVPVLFIRALAIRLAAAIYDPAYENLVMSNREMLLGDFKGETAAELQMYVELIVYGARMLDIAILIMGIYMFRLDTMDLLRVCLALTIGYEIFALFGQQKLSKLLRIGSLTETLYQPAIKTQVMNGR